MGILGQLRLTDMFTSLFFLLIVPDMRACATFARDLSELMRFQDVALR